MNRRLPAVLLTLAGCGAPPVEIEPPWEVKPRPEAWVPTPQPSELVVPARVSASVELEVDAQLDGMNAVYESELSFALGERYPARVTVTPTGPVSVASSKCAATRVSAAARWSTLTPISGQGATLALEGGKLTMDLIHEGVVRVLLEGEVTRVFCSVAGAEVTTLPLRHMLTVWVERISGFVVQRLNEAWPPSTSRPPRCGGATMALPAGTWFPLPAAYPLDGDGRKFEAANAPQPVELALRATRGLEGFEGRWRLDAPGRVKVELATGLPVVGVTTFEMVGSESLVSAEGFLALNLATLEGPLPTRLDDGAVYRVFYPALSSTVDLYLGRFADTDLATTTAGPLCSQVPLTWLVATSSTPEQCAAAATPRASEDGRGATVASIVGAGECRLEVAIPPTAIRWAAAFTTTR